MEEYTIYYVFNDTCRGEERADIENVLCIFVIVVKRKPHMYACVHRWLNETRNITKQYHELMLYYRDKSDGRRRTQNGALAGPAA